MVSGGNNNKLDGYTTGTGGESLLCSPPSAAQDIPGLKIPRLRFARTLKEPLLMHIFYDHWGAKVNHNKGASVFLYTELGGEITGRWIVCVF